jgi:hypothetical protein
MLEHVPIGKVRTLCRNMLWEAPKWILFANRSQVSRQRLTRQGSTVIRLLRGHAWFLTITVTLLSFAGAWVAASLAKAPALSRAAVTMMVATRVFICGILTERRCSVFPNLAKAISNRP